MGPTRRAWPTEPTSRANMGSQRLKREDQPLHESSSGLLLWRLTWKGCVIPNSGTGCISDSFACSWDFFPPVQLPVQILYTSFGSLDYSLTGQVWLLSFQNLCFFNEGQKGKVGKRDGRW